MLKQITALLEHLAKWNITRGQLNLVIFGVVLAILILLQYMAHITPDQYYYDAINYFNIGQSLFSSGHYSLEGISTDFRGYLFPSFLGICSYIDSCLGITFSFKIFSSVFIALLIVVYLNLCIALFARKRRGSFSIVVRSIVAFGLLVFFFYGLIIYPLSDLYAALLCICAGYFLYISRNASKWMQPVLLFMGGARLLRI